VAPAGRSARTTERPPCVSRQGCRLFIALCTRPRSTLFGGNGERGHAARIIPDKPARPLVFRPSRPPALCTPPTPSLSDGCAPVYDSTSFDGSLWMHASISWSSDSTALTRTLHLPPQVGDGGQQAAQRRLRQLSPAGRWSEPTPVGSGSIGNHQTHCASRRTWRRRRHEVATRSRHY
jgi:hypothetical protein